MPSLTADLADEMHSFLTNAAFNRKVPRARSVGELCQRLYWENLEHASVEVALSATTLRPARQPYKPYNLSDARRASSEKRFTSASLFAGRGGSSIGSQLAGADVRFAVEFSERAVAGYRHNNPTTHIEHCDVRDLLRYPQKLERLLSTTGLTNGSLDNLDASPPCQIFSVGNNGIGDQRVPTTHCGMSQISSATLPLDYARLVHIIRPKTSVMENVPGMLIRAPKLVEQLIESLRFHNGQRSYYVNYKVLSSSDFGVPQARKRVLIISVRKDVGDSIGLDSDESVLRLFPPPTHGIVSIRAAFVGLKQTDRDQEPFVRSIRRSPLPRLLCDLPPCPDRPIRLKRVTTNFTLVRCSWDHPAPTLVIVGQQPNGLSGAIHPELDRKFTVPELKRLFALPDDFKLSGTVEHAVEGICNMVPPLLMKALADRIYERVIKPYRAVYG